jgi:hypothetical protein
MTNEKKRVEALRDSYHQNHFQPIAVLNAVTGNKETGKRPAGKEWQNYEYKLGEAVSAAAINTGILLPDLYAIDVDCDDAETAQSVEDLILQHFGAIYMKRVRAGSSRFLTLYRSCGGIGKQHVGSGGKAVEVLSHGNQFVADGMHYSGAAIEWGNGVSPANFHKSELPLIAESQMRAFLLNLKSLFDTEDVTIHGWQPTPHYSAPVSGSHLRGMSHADLEGLLYALDNYDIGYDKWLKMMAAIYDACHGSADGKELARRWSAKSSKYDARDFEKHWRNCQQGIMNRIHTGSLVDAIRNQIPGWKIPSQRPIDHDLELKEWMALRRKTSPQTVEDDKREVVHYDDDPEINAVMGDYNRKFAVVADGGKVSVVTMGYNADLDRPEVHMLGVDAFKQMYGTEKVWVERDGKGKTVRKADIWLDHAKRRSCPNGFALDPSNSLPASVYNLWEGFGTEPSRGDWTLLNAMIFNDLAGGVQEHYDYIIQWIAHLVQKPAVSPQTALVFRGEEGTGKGTLGRALLRIMGGHGMQVTHAKHFSGSFNNHLRNALFVFADEAFFAGDKAGEGALKGLVTEEFRVNEAKGKDATVGRNRVHLMMASNNEWVVPASAESRRFAVFDVSAEHIQDHTYFTAINREMDNGGVEAMFFDLLKIKVDEYALRKIPETEGLHRQRALSFKGIDRWFCDILERGFVIEGDEDSWIDIVHTQEFVRSHDSWQQRHREKYPPTEVQIGKYLRGMFEQKRMPKNDDGKRHWGYCVGSLNEARSKFATKHGIKAEILWPDEAEASTNITDITDILSTRVAGRKAT